MKNFLESLSAGMIVAIFVLTFVYVTSAVAQTAPAANHSGSTANPALAATPSSGVVNNPTANTAPAASTANAANLTNNAANQPTLATPNANSAQNATPASGQAPAQNNTGNGQSSPINATN